MVVSEIMERLSPNMAPLTTAPIAITVSISVTCAKPKAIGAQAAMVPIEVPIAVAIKAEITNSIGKTKVGGISDSPSCTVASTLPMALLVLANAPANINTINIKMRLGWLAPLRKVSIAWFKCPLKISTARMTAGRAATGALI